eukprot:00785.XXX_835_1011_1 [CDS] Oithona nana genome sequencing.
MHFDQTSLLFQKHLKYKRFTKQKYENIGRILSIVNKNEKASVKNASLKLLNYELIQIE